MTFLVLKNVMPFCVANDRLLGLVGSVISYTSMQYRSRKRTMELDNISQFAVLE